MITFIYVGKKSTAVPPLTKTVIVQSTPPATYAFTYANVVAAAGTVVVVSAIRE